LAEPLWARDRETLRFRIRFLGVTVGHATFAFQGRMTVGGRDVYRLSVRADTTGALSRIYPVHQEIEYDLDPGTLAPLRQEYLAGRGKDDEVIYDQRAGRIVYRDRRTKEIRRTVEAAPGVYDPVTAAYRFRVRGPDGPQEPCRMYAGRKLWTVAARRLAVETVETPAGTYRAVLLEPVVMREGRAVDRWVMRLWMTDDERHTPVRVFAQFHKILDWTLVGELVPAERKG